MRYPGFVRTTFLLAAFSFSAPLAIAQQGPAPREDYSIVVEDVALPSGPSVDLHLTVFVNEAAPCTGRTVFAVPGFAHTAATFEPFVEALFAGDVAGQVPCRVVAIDFPAHGDSPAPAAGTFGFLGLNDYVASVEAALASLPEHGLRPDLVIAHSQGGLVVQLAQQQLVEQGSSLRAAYGIRDVILLAPVPPAEVAWSFGDSGLAISLLGGLFAADPVLGPHFAIPDFVWPLLFFTGPGFTPSPNMPSGTDVTLNGWNAPEPFISALQLVGAFGARASVDAGVFGQGSGTSLTVVTFEHDWIVTPAEGDAVYAHLTGTSGGAIAVNGPRAIHDMYVSDPAELLAALAPHVRIR
jgi:pimeloyl-ACP methyl ester carboxylesterase